MTTQLDERRKRLIAQHRLSDDEIAHIIAYNRRLLKTFSRPGSRSTPLTMSYSTFRDRFAVFIGTLVHAIRNRVIF